MEIKQIEIFHLSLLGINKNTTMKKLLLLLLILPLFTFGQVGIGTTILSSNTLLTLNAHGTNTQRNAINISMISPGSNAVGLNITSASQQARGFMYSNSTNGATNPVWGTGAELINTNIVSGYTAYRISGASDITKAKSYGLYGINGTNSSYTTNASTWALFAQGRAVISSESSPSSPLGTDLEVRNTTTGSSAPATISMRQTNQLTTSGSILSNLNFGDNFTTNPQAQIKVTRGAAGGTNDLPTDMIFSTTPDGSSTLTERMRIVNNGNVGVGSSTPNSTLTFNGGLQGKVRVINTDANVTLDNTDFFVISTNTFSANRTMTLPTLTAGTTDGKILIIRNGGIYSSNGWNLTAASGNTLSATGYYSTPLRGESGVILVSRGTIWYMISF